MAIIRFAAAAVAGVLLVAGSVPLLAASSASPMTEAFIANVEPNVDFLDRSSRMALDHSKSSRVREFARGEATDQTLAANAIDDSLEADPSVMAATQLPQDEAVVTGRSVAIDGQASVEAALVVNKARPLSEPDLDSLNGLQGRAFDEQYRLKQLEALRQIEAAYMAYIAKGDDPVFLGIANRELPKIEHRLALLRRM